MNKSPLTSIFRGFAKRRLSGLVIAIEPLYTAEPEIVWSRALTKIAISILLLPFWLPFVAFFAVMAMMIPASNFFSRVVSQSMSYFLMGRMLKKEQVPVRDIRLRDQQGQEHLVRMRGQLVAGSVSVGDEIAVEGRDRMGTLIVDRGVNLRTRSEIIIRRQ